MLLDVVRHYYLPGLVVADETGHVGITQDEAVTIRAGLLSCESTADMCKMLLRHIMFVSAQGVYMLVFLSIRMLAEYSVTCLMRLRRPSSHVRCKSAVFEEDAVTV